MALTRNMVYKKRISSSRGWTYWLYFVPASSTDLTYGLGHADFEANGTMEMPDFIHADKLKAKDEFADGVPLGLPLASELSISMRFDAMIDESANNWTVLRQWINNGFFVTPRMVNSRSLFIRNLWFIKSNDGDGTTTPSKYEWMGCQLPTPEKEYITDEKGAITFEIKCLDLMRSALQESLISDVVDLVTYTLKLLPLYMRWETGGTIYDIESPTGNFDYYSTNFVDLQDQIETVYNNILAAYTRSAVNTPTVSITSPLVFYEQSYDVNGQIGAEINVFNRTFISAVVDPDTSGGDGVVAGMIGAEFNGIPQVASSENSFFQFENWWDVYKYWFEGMFGKGFKNYNDSASPGEIGISLEIRKIFQFIPGGKTLTRSDFLVKPKIIKSYELINQGRCHFVDMSEKQNNEFAVKNDSLLWNDKAREIEPILHNMIPRPETTVKTGGIFGYIAGYDLMRNFFYDETFGSVDVMVKVHDWMRIDLGDGTFIDSDSIAGFDDLPIDDKLNSMREWIEDRHEISGYGHTFAKAALAVFGNENQGAIEGEVYLENALPRFLGGEYDIDVDTILGLASFSTGMDVNSDNAILTTVEADFVAQKSKSLWFIRGDR